MRRFAKEDFLMTFSCHVFVFFQSVAFQKTLKCNHLIKFNYIKAAKLRRKRPCFFSQRSRSLWGLLVTLMIDPNAICITASLVFNVRLHCPLGPYTRPFNCDCSGSAFKKQSMSCVVYLHVPGGNCKFLQLL